MSARVVAAAVTLALVVAAPLAIEGHHRWTQRSALADAVLLCVGRWTDAEDVRRSADRRRLAELALAGCQRSIAAWCAAAAAPAVVETACGVLPVVAVFTHGLGDQK